MFKTWHCLSKSFRNKYDTMKHGSRPDSQSCWGGMWTSWHCRGDKCIVTLFWFICEKWNHLTRVTGSYLNNIKSVWVFTRMQLVENVRCLNVFLSPALYLWHLIPTALIWFHQSAVGGINAPSARLARLARLAMLCACDCSWSKVNHRQQADGAQNASVFPILLRCDYGND